MTATARKSQPAIVAVLKAGANAEQIAITDISMKGCTARTRHAVNRAQPAILQLFENKGNGQFNRFTPISSVIQSVTQRKVKDTNIYDVTIAFKTPITASHGVAQALQKQRNAGPQHVETSLESKNSSLFIIPVTCHMCGQEHIPFRSLQSRMMESAINVFGVPQYKEALPGREFCDYNLVRVTVCPSCFYASGHVTDFIKENRVSKDVVEPFKKEPILASWNTSVAKRQQMIGDNMSALLGENRSVTQALISYDLAIAACDALLDAEKEKKEKLRNYEVGRKAVSYLMFKAEIMMNSKKPEHAEKLLKQALKRLQEIFPFLTRESSLKAASLMGMLGLYFEEYKVVSVSLTFLQQYKQNNKVRLGSDEHKAMVSSLAKLSEAYQDRAEFSRKKLNGFEKPF